MTNPLNPVLLLTHNNLSLTKRCVDSVRAQDIPTRIMIVDNGSTDGTVEWLNADQAPCEYALIRGANEGVSRGWNIGLNFLFQYADVEHCLVIGNDTSLSSWFYRVLLAHMTPAVGLLTGVAVDNFAQISPDLPPEPLVPYPDFSAFLISREAWQTIGPFDEQLVHYCGDCDWHIRAWRAGVCCYKVNLPFYHETSSTIRLAPEAERAEIEQQANRDREVFRAKYGCLPGTAEYEALFMVPMGGN